MFKILSLTKKAVKYTKFLSLIADTVKYFHDQGIERGLFSEQTNEAV